MKMNHYKLKKKSKKKKKKTVMENVLISFNDYNEFLRQS